MISPAEVERLRREEFPIVRAGSYLNHASHGPLPRSHVEAATTFLRAMSDSFMGEMHEHWVGKVDEVRALAGRLMNCTAADVALLKGTGECLGLVPLGLDWRSGDEVVTYEREFPSDVLPWLNLADRGVDLVRIPDRGGRYEAADVIDRMTSRTRVVNLSLVDFSRGFRAPLEEVGRACRERGIWFVVDAVQALGALRVDVQALCADIVCAHAYKWLLGGFGLAVCYCSPRAREELRVPHPGWKSLAGSADVTRVLADRLDFPDTARRFESSVQGLAEVHGMAASLSLLLSIGPEAIEDRVLGLRDRIADQLAAVGFETASSARPAERSGILAVRRPGVDLRLLVERLAAHRVSCAVREGWIRVSPHVYNDDDDIDRLVDCLRH